MHCHTNNIRTDNLLIYLKHKEMFEPAPCSCFSTSQGVGQKEVGVKTGGKEKTRITAVLAVGADGSKLPACLIFKGKPTAAGKTPAANSIERKFSTFPYIDKLGVAYPLGLVYAVDEIAWHTKRVFKEVWMPQVWNRRPGREGALGNCRQPDTLLAWADYTVHKTKTCKDAMEKSNKRLFLIPGGLTPKLQPCDGHVNKLLKSNMSRVYDDHMASPDLARNASAYPEPPSRGLFAKWVKQAWDDVDAESIRSSWRRAGLLLPFDGLQDQGWAKKELGSDAQRTPSNADGHGDAAGAEETDASLPTAKLLELLDVVDDDSTGKGGDYNDDSEVEVVAELSGADVVAVDS